MSISVTSGKKVVRYNVNFNQKSIDIHTTLLYTPLM